MALLALTLSAVVALVGVPYGRDPGVPLSANAVEVQPALTAAGTYRRPFAADSPWNSPIPTRPALDPQSARWVGYLSGRNQNQSALLHQTGVPIYRADASTPRYHVACSRDFGRCPSRRVPIPNDAMPSDSTDGAMVVIDASTGRHYDFWQLRRVSGQWLCSWCDSGPLDGDGRDSLTVGAGVSRLAGVVRSAEIAAGRIDHALVFASAISAPKAFRYPATKTDGANLAAVAVPLPEGARIQLDPSIDVDRLPGITPAEKTVAKALQRYGAYNIDNGGYHAMGFSFEAAPGGLDGYRASGLPYDYTEMPHIPWDKLRVLRSWNGR